MKLLLTSSLVFPLHFAQFQTIAPHCSPSYSTNKRLKGGKNKQACRWGLGKHIPPASAQKERGKKKKPERKETSPGSSPTSNLLPSGKLRHTEHTVWCKSHHSALPTAQLQPESQAWGPQASAALIEIAHGKSRSKLILGKLTCCYHK